MHPHLMAYPTGFSGAMLDRDALSRKNPEKLEKLWHDKDRLCLVLHEGQPVFQGANALFDHYIIKHMLQDHCDEDALYCGLFNNKPLFALSVKIDEASLLRKGFVVKDLRHLASHNLLPKEHLALFALARSKLLWHKGHKHCCHCGALTHLAAAGWERHCNVCNNIEYPRTDPVMISLVYNDKTDKILLGRQPHFQPSLFSCLAGFIEPGESLEEAVYREVFEETQLKIHKVSYITSQPWPYASSLMMGCIALTHDEDIYLNDKELEEARWFERDELKTYLERETGDEQGSTPPAMTIANVLMKAFLKEDA